MAGPIKIAVLADVKDVARELPKVESGLNDVSRTADKASREVGASFDRVAESSDALATGSAQVAGGLGDLGGALGLLPGPLGALGGGMEALSPAIMGVTGASDLLNAATEKFPGIAKVASAGARGLGVAVRFATGPVGLIIIGLTALAAGLVYAYKRSETFRNIVNGAFRAVRSGADALWSGIKVAFDKLKTLFLNFTGPGLLIKNWDKVKAAGKGAFNAIRDTARAAFNGIAGLWNGTVGKISFSVPDWVPGMGGKGWSVPDIPMLASGGIVTGPTLALVGEAGPEAVIPLDRLGTTAAPTVVQVHLTADAIDQLTRGRRLMADINTAKGAGARMVARTA